MNLEGIKQLLDAIVQNRVKQEEAFVRLAIGIGAMLRTANQVIVADLGLAITKATLQIEADPNRHGEAEVLKILQGVPDGFTGAFSANDN
jgi:hypothetical protein